MDGLHDDGIHSEGDMQTVDASEESGNQSMLITLDDMTVGKHEISVDNECIEMVQSVDVLVTTAPAQARISEEAISTVGEVDISQNWFTSRVDKKTLQENGLKWKQGQWSNEENEILRTNIGEYCQMKGIDAAEVIFETSKDQRKNFYRYVAKGLDRPLFSVYRRILRMYDRKNHIGKYTPEEIHKLRELRKTHGNDWSSIGATLGRSAGSVRDRCRLMKESCRYGTWQHDEEMRLAGAVYEISGAQPGEEVHHGLCWADVAQKVKTRTEKQCRAKWLNFLNWKQKGGAEWISPTDDYVLLVKLLGQGAQEENDIDWVELAKGWSSVRSPQWLRSKWWTLKRHVPNYQSSTFSDILRNLSGNISTGSSRASTSKAAGSILPQTIKNTASGTSKILPYKFTGTDGLKYTPYSSADGDTILLPQNVQLSDVLLLPSHAVLTEDLGDISTLPGVTLHDESSNQGETSQSSGGDNSNLIILSSNDSHSNNMVDKSRNVQTDSTSETNTDDMQHIVLLEEDLTDSIRNNCQSILVSHLSDPLLNSNSHGHHDLSAD